MSITSDERRSANASNLSVNFLQEVAELQSTLLALQQQLSLSFSGLQNQISVGVARVNKLLEMGAKISGGASNMTGHEAVSPSSSGSGSFSIPEHSEGFTMDKARTLLHRIPERPSLILTGRKVDIETPTVSSNSMAVLQSPTDGRSSIVLPESGIHSVFSLVIQEQHDRYQYHDPDFFPDTSPLFPAAAKLPSFEGGNRCLVKSNTVKAFQTLPIVKVNRLMSEEVIPKIPAAKANAQLTRINKGNASRQSERSQLSLGVKWDSADYNEDCDTEPSNESGLKRSKSASYDTAEPPVNTLSEPADSTRLGSGDRMSFFKLSQASSIGKFVGKIVLGNHFDDHVTNADTLLPPQQPERNMQRFFQPNNLSRQQSGNRQPHSRRNSLLSPTDDDGKQSRSPLVQISYGEDPDYRGKQMHRDDVHVRQPDSPPHERVSVTSRSIKDASSIYSTSTSHASNGISIKVQILEDPHEEPLPTPPTPEFTERDSKKPSIQTYTTEPELKEKNATSNWWSRLLFASMYEENDFQERSTLVESIQNRSLFTTGIHPLSPVAAIVNLVTTQGYFVALFFIPYRAAFYDPLNQVDSGLQWSITVIFVIDSVFNFFVPPLTKQTSDRPVPTPEELNIWQIKYSKQYLAIDILSMVPWGEIVRDEAILFPLEILCLIRAFRLPSKILQNPFFKLLHVRLQNIVGIGNVLSLLLAIGVIIVIFLHIQACILYHIGKMNGFFTWENQFSHWSHYPGGLKSAPAGDRYIFMLTESIGNVFPVAFKSETNVEQIFSFLFAIIGSVLYAALIGLISAAAVSYDAPGKLYRQKIDELTEYMNWKNINERTKKKLLDYYNLKYRGKYFEEKSLFTDMNEALQREVSSINCRRLIEKVPFINRNCGDGRDDLFMGQIANALVSVFYVPGDYIFHQGEKSTEMFFILSGRVNIIVKNSVVTSLAEGSFFGEVALIANIPRTASVQASTACSLYRLSASDFNSIIVEFADIKQRIDQIYEERMTRVRIEQGLVEPVTIGVMDTRPETLDRVKANANFLRRTSNFV